MFMFDYCISVVSNKTSLHFTSFAKKDHNKAYFSWVTVFTLLLHYRWDLYGVTNGNWKSRVTYI